MFERQLKSNQLTKRKTLKRVIKIIKMLEIFCIKENPVNSNFVHYKTTL